MLDIVSHRGVASDVAGVIAIAENDCGRRILTPPARLYADYTGLRLSDPECSLLRVGTVPGVFATAAFALPPFARAQGCGTFSRSPRAIIAGVESRRAHYSRAIARGRAANIRCIREQGGYALHLHSVSAWKTGTTE